MKHLLLTTIAAVLVVGCKQSEADSALIDAAVENNLEGVKQLLAAGADVDAKVGGFIRGWTPLHFAARDGYKEIVELLIAEGANVNANNQYGYTPLHLATTKEVAALLISNGADVNAKIDEGWTSLHSAVANGHKEVVEVLIAKGADVNAKDDDGDTPLLYAYSHWEIANLLRKHGAKTGEELKAQGK